MYFYLRYLVIVSGLEIGGKSEKSFPLQLFVDMVTGHVGDIDQQESSSSIVRVIVAGNSLSQDTQDKESLQKVYLNCIVQDVLNTTLCDKSLSVTCGRWMVFSGYSGFLHH